MSGSSGLLLLVGVGGIAFLFLKNGGLGSLGATVVPQTGTTNSAPLGSNTSPVTTVAGSPGTQQTPLELFDDSGNRLYWSGAAITESSGQLVAAGAIVVDTEQNDWTVGSDLYTLTGISAHVSGQTSNVTAFLAAGVS